MQIRTYSSRLQLTRAILLSQATVTNESNKKLIDLKRFTAEDAGVIQAWFDRLEIEIRIKKIIPSNIWNFDETGFQVGQGKKETVATRCP